MEDGVKFIFKTLIKVPCIIFVAYLILNMLMFSYTYFKLLGMSYVVMQTCVENNYLPNSEFTDLLKYVDDLNTNTFAVGEVTEDSVDTSTYNPDYEVVSYAGLVVGKTTSDEEVIAYYDVPLCATATTHSIKYAKVSSAGITPINDPTTDVSYSSEGLATTRKQYGHSKYTGVYARYKMVWPTTHSENVSLNESEQNALRKTKVGTLNIRITYTVPGLKYYPDMNYS
jgi:hypothetical protein